MQYLWVYPALACIIVFPFALAIFYRSFSVKTRLALSSSYVAAWGLLPVLLACPPIDFLNWFLD